MQITSLLLRRMPRLTASETRVAKYVLDHSEEIPFLSLQALAERSGTSDATVVRCCTSLGFSGFQHFKVSFTSELLDRGMQKPEPRSNREAFIASLTTDLRRTLDIISRDVIDAVALRLATCRHAVFVGLSGSGAVAEIMVAGLLSANVAGVRASDRVAIERWSAVVDEHDVLFGISHSGAAPEVTGAIRRARQRGALTVALTNAERSEMVDIADHTLLTSVNDRLLGSNACLPRIVQLVILEVLLEAVAACRLEAASAKAR
jgi:RpiR family transcriptional regulator, carbohydrate utilization regulator